MEVKYKPADNIKIIKAVEKYPVIYDTKTYPAVQCKGLWDQAWPHVAKELGLSVDHVKRRWINIRDCYKRYMRSMRSNKMTTPYYLERHLHFLRPFVEIDNRFLWKEKSSNKTTVKKTKSSKRDLGICKRIRMSQEDSIRIMEESVDSPEIIEDDFNRHNNSDSVESSDSDPETNSKDKNKNIEKTIVKKSSKRGLGISKRIRMSQEDSIRIMEESVDSPEIIEDDFNRHNNSDSVESSDSDPETNSKDKNKNIEKTIVKKSSKRGLGISKRIRMSQEDSIRIMEESVDSPEIIEDDFNRPNNSESIDSPDSNFEIINDDFNLPENSDGVDSSDSNFKIINDDFNRPKNSDGVDSSDSDVEIIDDDFNRPIDTYSVDSSDSDVEFIIDDDYSFFSYGSDIEIIDDDFNRPINSDSDVEVNVVD
ncbi:dentin sialophosphoprotein-like [Macrosteles quadrilineatus]|uniref:dentin sialophosphoprotein-like n=1 Tax=Macrosteles quadrilineatus TaxID=74068 RepID=UPI0023E20DBE|nr:dentin sialophosphoprotein-like [Macrosteles quadrilineatus]